MLRSPRVLVLILTLASLLPSVALALTPFPSISASLEYYPKEGGNAPSLVAVIIPERLEGREISGVEIPLTSSRAILPQPTSTIMFLNDGEWGASDWTCTIGSSAVRCSGSTSLQVGKKTCIALYLPSAIDPPSGLSFAMLGKGGETLFTVGAELTTEKTEQAPADHKEEGGGEQAGNTESEENKPLSEDHPVVNSLPSRRNTFMVGGIALAAVGGGLLAATKMGVLSAQPFVGSGVLILGVLAFVYSMFIPRQIFFSWSCPNNCTKDSVQCRVSYAVSTSTDSVATEEQNELEAQKTIASVKLLELPFTAIDRLDAWNAESLLELYKEVATEILGLPDTPGEVYGSEVMKRGLGLKDIGAVVDLDKIEEFAQTLHSRRKLIDQATGGIQVFAHYEVDQCVESRCWVVSTQTNWQNKSSWFVPLSPEGTGYSHPFFDKHKPQGVYLWAPSVLAAMNGGNGDKVAESLAKQALAGMPPACEAIVKASAEAAAEDEWEPDPEIFNDTKGWLKKKK